MSVFFLGIPLVILIHELGHYGVARAYGYSANLSYASVHFTMPRDEHEGVPGMMITLAGPLVNFLFAIVGAIGLWVFGRKESFTKLQTLVVWGCSVLLAGGGRGVMKVFSPSGSDEAKVAVRLGFPEIIGPLVMSLPALFFAYVLFRFHWRNDTMLSLIVGLVAGGAGMLTWLTLLGPVVLPRP